MQLVQARLQFWDKLPFKLFGIFACARDTCTVAEARSIAADCCAEYDAALLAGRRHKLHRVAHSFLAPGRMFFETHDILSVALFLCELS